MAVVCYLSLAVIDIIIMKLYQPLPLLIGGAHRTRLGVILHDEVLMLTSAISYMCADMLMYSKMDPPRSGQPLYNGRLTCLRLILP